MQAAQEQELLDAVELRVHKKRTDTRVLLSPLNGIKSTHCLCAAVVQYYPTDLRNVTDMRVRMNGRRIIYYTGHMCCNKWSAYKKEDLQ